MRTYGKWIADKRKEAANEQDLDKYIRKAYLVEFIEGYATAAIILYPIVCIGGWYWRHKASKK